MQEDLSRHYVSSLIVIMIDFYVFTVSTSLIQIIQ